MKKFLFEYKYDGALWGFEILAENADEAEKRVNALRWAKIQGEVMLKIPHYKTIWQGIAAPFVNAFKSW